MPSRTLWVLFCGAAIVTIGMGIRASFGVFLPPITADLGIGRADFGLAIAIQTIAYGLVQPFTGMIADRFGAARIVVIGALVYAAGLVVASMATDTAHLAISLGLMIGLALSATTFVTVIGAVGKVVPEQHRSLAFGLVTAGGSFGQFAVIPGAQAMITSLGWQQAFLGLAILAGFLIVLALGVRGEQESKAPLDGQTLAAALGEARGHQGFWLLSAGFFTCGFHVSFIGIHLPAFLADSGMSPSIGAWSLAMIGLFNIVGSYVFGVWGGRQRKKHVLAGLYFARAAVVVLILLVPLTPVTALVFSGMLGFLWLGTVPLTSGLVAQIFGTRYLSSLFGFVFLAHQVGGFLGAWLAGAAHDRFGSYDAVWIATALLAVLSAVLHMPISDAPAPSAIEASA